MTFGLFFSPINRNLSASNFDLSGSLILRKWYSLTRRGDLWSPAGEHSSPLPRLADFVDKPAEKQVSDFYQEPSLVREGGAAKP